MAGAAKAAALDEIAAAIPFSALRLIGDDDARLEVKPVPQPHPDTEVEGKAQFRLRYAVAHRLKRRKVGADCQNVVAGQLCEIGVGEGRIVARSVRRNALTQRPQKVFVAPAADTRLAV